MVEKFLYPCVITEDDGVFYVNFPDFEACFTDGDTLDEALYNAKEVLTAVLLDMAEHGEAFPKVGKPTPENGGMVVYVDVVKSYVLAKASNQSVKKTLTVPKWLNDMATEKGLNFSQLLQKAIREELQV
ncbi:Phage-related protein [Streptococcus sp. DD10]|uniref:type II toxin-antitoxin system HicB family antitoxin n=1 Tax=Streptococcus sp. DD10 TaxID=1777878 RepID=UPI000796560D|nr:type II toxin-antitoxin system HicB family antitoxin [Streptococcus sp. DD10]KXT74356.1 Phage-related protein [Streptococcus sp. DD10]